jgi:hypothetical protein
MEGEEPPCCVICMEAPRQMAAVHGDSAHLCVCAACCQRHKGAAVLARCPMCQMPVQAWLRTHI